MRSAMWSKLVASCPTSSPLGANRLLALRSPAASCSAVAVSRRIGRSVRPVSSVPSTSASTSITTPPSVMRKSSSWSTLVIEVMEIDSCATPHEPLPAITGNPTTSWSPFVVEICSAPERTPRFTTFCSATESRCGMSAPAGASAICDSALLYTTTCTVWPVTAETARATAAPASSGCATQSRLIVVLFVAPSFTASAAIRRFAEL